MRHYRFFLLGFLAAMAHLSAQSNYYFPQVVDGPAASSGASVRTTIVLSNTAASNATVTIAVTDDDGSPRQPTFSDGAGNTFPAILKPDSTRIFQTEWQRRRSAATAIVTSSAPIRRPVGEAPRLVSRKRLRGI